MLYLMEKAPAGECGHRLGRVVLEALGPKSFLLSAYCFSLNTRELVFEFFSAWKCLRR